MNDKNKRLFAKEILYSFFGIFCIIVLWGYIEVKNYLINSDIKKITVENLTIKKQLDSLSKTNVLLDKYYLKKLKSNINKMNDKGYSVDDIGNMVDAFSKKFGRKEIIEKRVQLEKSKILSIQNYKNTQNKLIDDTQKIEILTWGVFIIFGLIYPFRFAYYSLMWSVKTLKTKK